MAENLTEPRLIYRQHPHPLFITHWMTTVQEKSNKDALHDPADGVFQGERK